MALLAATTAALPTSERRQLGDRVGTTLDELEDGSCRDITFIFARGSTEIGNIVRSSPNQPGLQSRNCAEL